MKIKCYACDAASAGRAKHDGQIKPACVRHRDPAYKGVRIFAHLSKSPEACIYCGRKVGRGGHDWTVDGVTTYAHDKCHQEQCE